MLRDRNVKIIATIGPASSDYDILKACAEAGVDVFRLNMSHGTHDEIAARHKLIRKVEADLKRPVCILADLQGPKLRVGVFGSGSVELKAEDKFSFDLDPREGDASRVHLPHPEIFKAIKVGARLLVNDGKIVLRVEGCSGKEIHCIVEVGGTISDRKGVNVPDVILDLDALSHKDRADLEFVCQLGVEWLGLSFVQRRADIIAAKTLADGRALILTKVEKPSAVEHFDDILEETDALMVARGDLGVEMPLHSIPSLQKKMIRRARAAGKPVVVATQMLESMIDAPVPTRAEVSDVATAIYEGADAVMLSAESAVGSYPIEAIETMDSIAKSVENDEASYRQIIEAARVSGRPTTNYAIAAAAREIAETTQVKLICCLTSSGGTARIVSRERPRVPILLLTPEETTLRRCCLYWGTECVKTGLVSNFDEAVALATSAAKAHGLALPGDSVIITAGVPFNQSGSTNIIRVEQIS